jgi:hypothetical protein
MTEDTTNVVVFGNATINADLFKEYSKKAMEELTEQAEHAKKAKSSGIDFKETVEALHTTTKVPKKELTAFFKARFAEKQAADEKEAQAKGTGATIERGHLFEVLKSTLDD